MKKMKLWITAICLLLLPLATVSATRAEPTPQLDEPAGGAVVCAPGAYPVTPDYCVPLGPSRYLTELSKLGWSDPPRPLPASKPDPGLTTLPYRYFHLSNEPVPLFSGIPADPNSGYSSQFPPGFVYVS